MQQLDLEDYIKEMQEKKVDCETSNTIKVGDLVGYASNYYKKVGIVLEIHKASVYESKSYVVLWNGTLEPHHEDARRLYKISEGSS